MHKTMHILDVISSVSRFSKCNKVVGGWGFAPDPTRELEHSPDSLAGFMGPTLKLLLLRGLERRGREGGEPPK